MTRLLLFHLAAPASIRQGCCGKRPRGEGEEAMTDYRKLFDLTGRKALVLGAGSGIGKASAEALAALGAETHCADLDLAHAEATAAAIRSAGGKAAASPPAPSNAAQIPPLLPPANAALTPLP